MHSTHTELWVDGNDLRQISQHVYDINKRSKLTKGLFLWVLTAFTFRSNMSTLQPGRRRRQEKGEKYVTPQQRKAFVWLMNSRETYHMPQGWALGQCAGDTSSREDHLCQQKYKNIRSSELLLFPVMFVFFPHVWDSTQSCIKTVVLHPIRTCCGMICQLHPHCLVSAVIKLWSRIRDHFLCWLTKASACLRLIMDLILSSVFHSNHPAIIQVNYFSLCPNFQVCFGFFFNGMFTLFWQHNYKTRDTLHTLTSTVHITKAKTRRKVK